MRFFLFNINVFNRGLPGRLPALLHEAGGADVLMFNEVTRGLERDLLAAAGGDGRRSTDPARTSSASFRFACRSMCARGRPCRASSP